MGKFGLDTAVWVPSPPEEVFEFFSSGFNLEEITPPWLHFQVVDAPAGQLHAGAEIGYRLRLRGIPFRWRSRIAAWEPPHGFVDEQIRGPYRAWRHEHRFKAERGGTRCEDHVRYEPPGGVLADRLFVRREVERIFAYRKQRIEELFGAAG